MLLLLLSRKHYNQPSPSAAMTSSSWQWECHRFNDMRSLSLPHLPSKIAAVAVVVVVAVSGDLTGSSI
jgi:hypothetical protein